jgi:hypothetical protein
MPVARTAHSAMYTVYCILYTVYCILYTVYCIYTDITLFTGKERKRERSTRKSRNAQISANGKSVRKPEMGAETRYG